jgi:hypothetical protein
MAHTLLCALIAKYVSRMFFLVSSAHSMGRQEAKQGEHQIMVVQSQLTYSCVQKLSETPLAITPANKSVQNQVIEPKSDEVRGLIHVLRTLMDIWIQGLFENSRLVVPTTTEYITASGKQALALLESAAKVIPVPFLQDAIGVALKVIELCDVRGILPRDSGCETIHNMLLSGRISSGRKGQGVARQSMPFDGRYRG